MVATEGMLCTSYGTFPRSTAYTLCHGVRLVNVGTSYFHSVNGVFTKQVGESVRDELA